MRCIQSGIVAGRAGARQVQAQRRAAAVYNRFVQAPTPTTERHRPAFGRPQIYFFSELSAAALDALLRDGQTLAALAEHGYGVAVAMRRFDEATAEVVRLLSASRVPVVAWLVPTADDELWFNLRNYPQAVERYRAFYAWAQSGGLQLAAVGLEIEPPGAAVDDLSGWSFRRLVRRLGQARENVLFSAARAAYTDLIAAIHHDGYEVHAYQLPILADDRRAGSTLAQRTLDIVDVPADVEVLLCYSSVPLERLDNDLGGALIDSYGPQADGIGVGAVAGSGDGDALPSLSWDALERDLILAAHHTDTMYVYSLEGCAERGLIQRIARVDWDAEPAVSLWKRAVVAAARLAILAGLFFARFSRAFFAWLGWGLFAILLARRIRGAVHARVSSRGLH